MAKRRRRTPEQIINKPAEGQKLLASGLTVEEVCRQFGIAESTWARWLSQYDQYYIALIGGDNKSGCADLAVDSDPDPSSREREGIEAELFSLLGDLEDRIQSDSRVVADRERGTGCLVDSGADFLSVADAQNHFTSLALDLEQLLFDYAVGGAGTRVVDDGNNGESNITLRDENGDVISSGSDQGPGADEVQAQLDAAHEEERDAVRDFVACHVSFEPLYESPVQREVRVELERDFLEANQSLIDSLALVVSSEG